MWARIDDKTLVEFIDFDPQGCFPPQLKWIAIPDWAQGWARDGWIVDGDGVAPPSMESMRDQARERIKHRRKKAEEGGATLPDGTALSTDRDAQGQAFRLAAAGNPTAYKAPTGWIDNADPKAISRAIQDHVAACFAREKQIDDLIGSVRTPKALAALIAREIAQGWPKPPAAPPEKPTKDKE